jgi:hypothetical protein
VIREAGMRRTRNRVVRPRPLAKSSSVAARGSPKRQRSASSTVPAMALPVEKYPTAAPSLPRPASESS